MVEYDKRHLDIRRISESMRYGPQQFKEDWDTAIAISQLMGVHEPYPDQEWMLESCMNRVLAYLQNNPEERPWES